MTVLFADATQSRLEALARVQNCILGPTIGGAALSLRFISNHADAMIVLLIRSTLDNAWTMLISSCINKVLRWPLGDFTHISAERHLKFDLVIQIYRFGRA